MNADHQVESISIPESLVQDILALMCHYYKT